LRGGDAAGAGYEIRNERRGGERPAGGFGTAQRAPDRFIPARRDVSGFAEKSGEVADARERRGDAD
jgi:hypothetical protein